MRARLQAYRDRKRIQQLHVESRYRTLLADIPDGLLSTWRQNAHLEFPGIPNNADFFARSLEGLLQFFDCASRTNTPCMLPSRAADSVWHAWLLLNADGLQAFCRTHFGRAIPHVAAENMRSDADCALAHFLVQARKHEGCAPASLSLPRLFQLDALLAMPRGFGYLISRGQVAFVPLDERGKVSKTLVYPQSMAPYALFHAGLIDKAEYDAEKREAQTRGGAGTVAANPDIGCDSDGPSADGGGSDGGACGSGCGGGGCGS